MQTLLKSLSTYPANDVYLETLFNNAPRGYQHQPYVNPLEGVSEAFAKGVYEAPGELVRLLEAFGEYQGGRKSSKPYSRAVDDFTQVNEMGYNPDDYGASPLLQSLARFGGNVVGDPLNAIPGAYVGKQAAVKTGQVADDLARLLGKEALRPPMRNQSGMVAYHGSPHKFDRFDHSKMGTGEGAQAYGWGTYIAESPDVAKTYSSMGGDYFLIDGAEFNPKRIDDLTNPGAMILDPQGEAVNLVGRHGIHEARSQAVTRLSGERMNQVLREIDKLQGKDVQFSKGNMYQVDLPDEKIAQMLDWDGDIPDTPEIRKLWNKVYDEPFDPRTVDGSRFYNDLSEAMLSQEGASMELKKAGIPGIKYFDGNSRTAGQGTRNFVVFDENDLTILERNGEKLQQSLPSGKEWYRGGQVGKKDGVTFFTDNKDTAANWAGKEGQVFNAQVTPKKTYDFDADPLNLQDKYQMAAPGEAGWSMDGPLNELKKEGYDSYQWSEWAGDDVEKNIAIFDQNSIQQSLPIGK